MKKKNVIAITLLLIMIVSCFVLKYVYNRKSNMTVLHQDSYEKYGVDVDMHYSDQENSYWIKCILNEKDVNELYGTESGRSVLNQLATDIVVSINEPEMAAYIKAECCNEIEKFSIVISLAGKSKAGIKTKVIGYLSSDAYSLEDWFTEENQKIQLWIGGLGESYTYEEIRSGLLDLKTLPKY